MSGPPSVSISLIMRQGPHPGRVFTLNKETLTLGRARGNDIVIEDNEVSRRHARLTRQGEVWILEDLNSRNGTTFNGQRITGPVVLTPGSQVGLGPDVVFAAEAGVPSVGDNQFSQAPSAGETLPPTPVPQVVSPTAPAAPVQAAPPPKKSGRWYVLVGAVAAIVLLLACAAAAAYLYLKPTITGPSAVAGLSDGAGPFVAFQDPAPGTRVDEGDSVLVFATARDADKVTRMDLWVDDKLMVQQTSPDPDGVNPLSLIHSLVADEPGTHNLTVRAYSALGQMGESPPINVTVLQADADDENKPEPSLYVVQQGDTLESIAKKLGSTVAAIKSANPGLGDTVKAGQIIAVPLPRGVIAPPQAPVAGKQTPQAQAWAGKQDKQTPPATDGQKTLVKPPQQPTPKTPAKDGQQQPAKPPSQDKQQPSPQPGPAGKKAPPPVWDPDKPIQGAGAWPADPPKDTLKPPLLGKPTVSDCEVTLTWQDRSDETRFLIKRSSGSPPAESTVAAMEANKTSFRDQVPVPGKYTYTIIAEKIKGQKTERGTSNPQPVTVSPTTVCGSPRKMYKQAHFEPIYFKPTDAKYTKAALFVDLNDAVFWRIPHQERSYVPVGNWLGQGKFTVPAPVSVYLNPEEGLRLDVISRSCTDGQPPGKSQSLCTNLDPHSPAVLPANTLSSKDKRDMDAQAFSLAYRLWVEDVEWTGKGTTRDIPPPTLHLAKGAEEIAKVPDSSPFPRDSRVNRVLWWEFPTDKQKVIDGFVIYRTYACPHQNTQIKAPQVVRALARDVGIFPKTEPVGCEAQYWVSAYGPAGESAPSNVITEKTSPSVTALQVDFTELTLGQPDSVPIHLYANQYTRDSGQMYVPISIRLSEMPFDGMTGNNVLVVQLDSEESLQFGLEAGAAGKNGTCKVEKTLRPPPQGWESLKAESYTLRSQGASPCDVMVDVKPVKSLQAGQMVRPQADIEIEGIYLIGRDVYARLWSDGPDALPANQVRITSSWRRDRNDPPIYPPTTVTRWWTPNVNNSVVKINTIPLLGGLDAEESLKRLYLDVEAVPVDFTDPDTSNNQKKNQKGVDISQFGS